MENEWEKQETETEQRETSLSEPEGAPSENGQPQTGSGKNLACILLGLLAFIGLLAFCWNTAGNAHRTADIGVLYAKDNGIYFFDLENEPYCLAESVGRGGSYHYYYSAWGATVTETGDWVYYPEGIDENGMFRLFRKQADDPAAEPEMLSEDVLDYRVSRGRVAAFLRADGDGVSLWLTDGTNRLISDRVQLADTAYELSGDGETLLYTEPEEDGLHLYALSTAAGAEPVEVCKSVEMYALAEEADTVYYVAGGETGEGYHGYRYALRSGKTELAAENVVYMEVMPNGRDLLYCRTAEEKVLYRDLIEDDMREADAALSAETAGEALAEKQERDRIRQAMADGEGFDPVLLDCYILTNGRSVKVAGNVISAVSVANDRPFATGYRAVQPSPIPISELDGNLQTVEYAYYGALAYGGQEAFLADGTGNCRELPSQGGSVQAETVRLSKDGSRVAYFVWNAETSSSDLAFAEVQRMEDAALLQTGAESMAFLGGGHTLGYYCNYANGVGTVATSEGSAQGNACGVYYAEDAAEMYFISEPGATGNGTLKRWDGKRETAIAADTFAFQYKGNGKLTYLQNYTLADGKGDLYYYDGKQSRLLDTGVTAIFMY